MKHLATIVVFCALAWPTRAEDSCVITNAGDLSSLIFNQTGFGRRFALDVTVIAPTIPGNTALAVKDATGTAVMNLGPRPPSAPLASGDRIRVSGEISQKCDGRIFADCNPPVIIAHGNPVKARDIAPERVLRGECRGELIRLSGIVLDVFHDEIDPQFMFMVMNCGHSKIYVGVNTTIAGIQPFMESLIGLEISVEGVCIPLRRGGRQLIGHYVLVYRKSDIRILSTSLDPFDAPELGALFNLTPAEISNLGRHRIVGHVIATYGRNVVILKTTDGRIVRAEMIKSELPRFGDPIETVGFPECNLYRINLSRAIWRNAAASDFHDDPPVFTIAKSLLADDDGKQRFNHQMHGATVRMRGTVLSLPGIGSDDGRFYMKDGDYIVPIDVSAAPDAIRDVRVGCVIETTGTCIMDSENWRPNSVFPRIMGFMVVTRRTDDIRILSYPPWWTPGRLLTVIGALLGMLASIFIWNRMLNHRAELRGQELADEKVAHFTSDLKVYERTRLAVELHDSLSQNLTGVSLAIRAANRLAASDPDGMNRHLETASRSLDSCREELRNCLWDLRNLTLEESDMNKAIQQTVAPHIGNAHVSIQFNVPRDRLSDNTAHAILRIIRELVSNSVRHGAANNIMIAGAIDSGQLVFSVADDGCGFHPDNHPGAKDGHFGLQGIQDRIDGLDGSISIISHPGGGAKVTISIKAKGKA